MAFSIGSIFSGRPAPAPAPAPVMGGQAAPAPAMQLPAPGAPAPQPGAPAAQPEPPKNPLDAFSGMWQTPDPSTTPADPLAAPIFGADPAKLAEAARGINIQNQVPAELMTRVMQGGDPAAIVELVNFATQQAVGLSAQLTAQTTEQGFQRYSQRLDQALPSRVSKAQLNQLPAGNPALQHAAARPLVDMARGMISAQNPGKTPQEIAQMADNYLSTLATEAFQHTADGQRMQQQQRSNSGPQGDSFDWDAWGQNQPGR